MVGRVIKGVGGFYYVSDGENVVMGNARGNLKRHKDLIVVGDIVDYEIRKEDGDCIITKVHPRKTILRRPPVANLDKLIIVFAATQPDPNPIAIDKMCAYCEWAGIEIVMAITKVDLVTEEELRQIEDVYKGIYPVIRVNNLTGQGWDEIRERISGQSVALAGPSGVGKSTILNGILGREDAETGGISEKTQRGKHTTRHVEIFELDNETRLYDTPGFTSLDIPEIGRMELRELYPEFRDFQGECKYRDCVHRNEPDCGIKNALAEGKIHPLRYENYNHLYEEVSKCQR